MAKIDNEKLTAAKKTLRADIEERRRQMFTPTDALESLRAEIVDMAAVGYSMKEIGERLGESLGIRQIPMSRVRKILKEAAETATSESTEIPSASGTPLAEKTHSAAQEAEAPVPQAGGAETEENAPPASQEAVPAAKALPAATPAVANAGSAIKESLQRGSAEKSEATPPIKQAAEAILPPQAPVGKKEIIDVPSTGNGTRISESGG